MNSRPLPYDLRDSIVLENETPALPAPGLPSFPEDPDERTIVLFELSLNEFVKLASSVDVGRDIAYPEASQYIWWLWNRTLIMTFCELVAQCIEENAGVQAALNAFMQNAFNPNAGSMTPPPASVLQENAYGANPDCDRDKAWGNIRDGLIERSFGRVADVLQNIELVTDNQELLSETLAGIPVLGEVFETIGVDSWLNWFDEVREFAADAFAAGDTVDFRDGAACDLFCLYLENCSLSHEQIFEYWRDRAIALEAGYANAFVDIFTIIDALASPELEDAEFFVCFLMAASYGFQTFINDWFGIRVANAKSDLLLGTPSADWIVLCDCAEIRVRIYNDFARTVLKAELFVSVDEPFDIIIEPSVWGTNEFFAVWDSYLPYAYTVEDGAYTATTAEVAYAYIEEDGDIFAVAPGLATDLPTPASARGIFMNANESDTSSHTVRLTLSEPPGG